MQYYNTIKYFPVEVNAFRTAKKMIRSFVSVWIFVKKLQWYSKYEEKLLKTFMLLISIK